MAEELHALLKQKVNKYTEETPSKREEPETPKAVETMEEQKRKLCKFIEESLLRYEKFVNILKESE